MSRVIVSCEHGGNFVPPAHRKLFREHAGLLEGHRGYDPGAAPLASRIARRAGATLLVSNVTRLLVDLNRSLRHPSLFSGVTRSLPRPERRAIIEEHYLPYRSRVEQVIREATDEGTVLHLSVHTFTPELDGSARNAAIGLLYDPSRLLERSFSREWKDALRSRLQELKVRLNYPYRGAADGLTTHLRRMFHPDRYLGIELEVNQKHFVEGRWTGGLPEEIAEAFLETVLESRELAGRARIGEVPASGSDSRTGTGTEADSRGTA